jgi:hypothetical protein
VVPVCEARIASLGEGPRRRRRGRSGGRPGGLHIPAEVGEGRRRALRVGYLRDLLLYKLTLEAQKRVASSRLSRREIIRRLGTSAAQFYRLLDQTNYRKSIDQLLSLLHVLDCDVEIIVRAKSA